MNFNEDPSQSPAMVLGGIPSPPSFDRINTMWKHQSQEQSPEKQLLSRAETKAKRGEDQPTDNNNNMSKSKKEKRALTADFEPSSYTVICGRTQNCYNSAGNRRFRATVKLFLQDYMEAKGKSEKSAVVSRVLETIEKASPEGSFVVYEKGRWHEVSDRVKREKIGGHFRDLLHTKYRSSAKSKQARKVARSKDLQQEQCYPIAQQAQQQLFENRLPQNNNLLQDYSGGMMNYHGLVVGNDTLSGTMNNVYQYQKPQCTPFNGKGSSNVFHPETQQEQQQLCENRMAQNNILLHENNEGMMNYLGGNNTLGRTMNNVYQCQQPQYTSFIGSGSSNVFHPDTQQEQQQLSENIVPQNNGLLHEKNGGTMNNHDMMVGNNTNSATVNSVNQFQQPQCSSSFNCDGSSAFFREQMDAVSLRSALQHPGATNFQFIP